MENKIQLELYAKNSYINIYHNVGLPVDEVITEINRYSDVDVNDYLSDEDKDTIQNATDDYRIDIDGVVFIGETLYDIGYAIMCEDCGEYCLSDDSYDVNTSNGYSHCVCRDCVDDERYVTYNGSIYDVNSLEYYELFICDNCRDVYSYDYLSNCEDSFYCCDCDPDDNEYIDEYGSNCTEYRCHRETKYKIGFEIEKVDEKMYYERLDTLKDKWNKEKDGSLSKYGFEIISPVYDLFSDDIIKDIKGDPCLLDYVESEYNTKCGGHINISINDDGEKTINAIYGAIPLLYAMFEKRLLNTYCKAEISKQKYSAINVKNDRVELRLFSAVRDVDNLEFRLGLVQILIKEYENKPFKSLLVDLLSEKSNIYKHLLKVYSKEKILEKISKSILYSKYIITKSTIKNDKQILVSNRLIKKLNLKKDIVNKENEIISKSDKLEAIINI